MSADQRCWCSGGRFSRPLGSACDYVTDRTIIDTPAGPLKLPHTIEFDPVTSGTVIHTRFGPPKSKRDLALAAQVGTAYGDALHSSLPRLVELVDAELAARQADRGPEPELAPPSPERPLSRLQPLTIIE